MAGALPHVSLQGFVSLLSLEPGMFCVLNKHA